MVDTGFSPICVDIRGIRDIRGQTTFYSLTYSGTDHVLQFEIFGDRPRFTRYSGTDHVLQFENEVSEIICY